MVALRLVAPGTPLREGLDRILQAQMGALIVVGDGPEVLDICSGGFLLDAEFTPAAAVGAGQDGRRHHPRRRRHAGSPGPTCTSCPTPTCRRRRPAPGTAPPSGSARQIDVPGDHRCRRTCRSSRSTAGGEKHTLEPIPRVLARANQALQILERYKARLDAVSGSLSALEVEDLVTVRDVVTVLQRAEMVRRIAEEIEGYIVELGADGRLVLLQLEELIGGVEDDRRLVVKDYFHVATDLDARRGARRASPSSTTEELLDLKSVAAVLHLAARASTSTARCSRAATGCCTRSRGCPSRCPTTSSSASATCRRSCGPASPTSTRSRASARRAPGRSRTASSRLAETSHPRPVRLRWPSWHDRDRTRSTSSTSR